MTVCAIKITLLDDMHYTKFGRHASDICNLAEYSIVFYGLGMHTHSMDACSWFPTVDSCMSYYTELSSDARLHCEIISKDGTVIHKEKSHITTRVDL